LELTQIEWKSLRNKNLKEELEAVRKTLQPFVGKLKLNLNHAHNFLKAIKISKTFYEKAEERERYLFENFENGMKKLGTNTGIVIAGGFHSEAFREHFKRKNYSLLQISPHITDPKKQIPYWEIFEGKRTPLEALFSGQDVLKTVKARSAFLLAKPTASRDPAFLQAAAALLLAVTQKIQTAYQAYARNLGTAWGWLEENIFVVDSKTFIEQESGEVIALEPQVISGRLERVVLKEAPLRKDVKRREVGKTTVGVTPVAAKSLGEEKPLLRKVAIRSILIGLGVSVFAFLAELLMTSLTAALYINFSSFFKEHLLFFATSGIFAAVISYFSFYKMITVNQRLEQISKKLTRDEQVAKDLAQLQSAVKKQETLQDVFELITREGARLCGFDLSGINLWEPEGEETVARIDYQYYGEGAKVPERDQKAKPPIRITDNTFTALTLKEKKMLMRDYRKQPELLSSGARDAGITFSISLPIYAGDEILGNIIFSSADPSFPTGSELLEDKTILNALNQLTVFLSSEIQDKKLLYDFKAVFDSFDDFLFSVNREGTILDFKAGNPDQLIFAQPYYAGSNLFRDFLNQEEHAFIQEKVLEALDEAQPKTAEFSYGPAHYQARVIPLSKNQATIALHDISNLKEKEKLLVEAEKAKQFKSIVGGLMHEINNTNSVIMMTSDMLKMRLNQALKKEGRFSFDVLTGLKDANIMMGASVAIATLLTNMQSVARINLGPPEKWKVTLVAGLILEALKKTRPGEKGGEEFSYQEKIRDQAIDLKLIASPAFQAEVMPDMLENAIGNLIANAISAIELKMKIAEEKGAEPGPIENILKIEMGVLPKSPDQFFIRVEDTGSGIPNEDRDKIWTTWTDKRFHKAVHGFGFGLPVAKNIIEDHGGELVLERSREGEGSSFLITLPIKAEGASLGEAADPLNFKEGQIEKSLLQLFEVGSDPTTKEKFYQAFNPESVQDYFEELAAFFPWLRKDFNENGAAILQQQLEEEEIKKGPDKTTNALRRFTHEVNGAAMLFSYIDLLPWPETASPRLKEAVTNIYKISGAKGEGLSIYSYVNNILRELARAITPATLTPNNLWQLYLGVRGIEERWNVVGSLLERLIHDPEFQEIRKTSPEFDEIIESIYIEGYSKIKELFKKYFYESDFRANRALGERPAEVFREALGASEEPSAPETKEKPRKEIKTILILEDDKVLREVLSRHFRKIVPGVLIRGAGNEKEVLEAIEDPKFSPIDLAVLDLNFPETAEEETSQGSPGKIIEALRSQPRGKQSAIVIASGQAEAPKELGPFVDKIIMKPYGQEEIINLVAEIKGKSLGEDLTVIEREKRILNKNIKDLIVVAGITAGMSAGAYLFHPLKTLTAFASNIQYEAYYEALFFAPAALVAGAAWYAWRRATETVRTQKQYIDQIKRTAEEEKQKLLYDLNERMKALAELYRINQIIGKFETAEETLQEAVRTLPSAWQYPGITAGRIVLDEKEYTTANFKKTKWVQAAPIMIDGNEKGAVEVYYLEERPERNEGPFTLGERKLINAIAEELGLVIARKQQVIAISHLAAIVQGSNVIASIKSLDREPRILMVNKAFEKAAGVSTEEAVGKTDQELFGGRGNEEAVGKYVADDIAARELKPGDLPVKIQEEVIYPDGEVRQVSTRKFPVFDPETKELIATASISVDITERKKAEKKAEEQTRIIQRQAAKIAGSQTLVEKSLTVGDLAHYLRSPLSAMHLSVSEIQENFAGLKDEIERVEADSLVQETLSELTAAIQKLKALEESDATQISQALDDAEVLLGVLEQELVTHAIAVPQSLFAVKLSNITTQLGWVEDAIKNTEVVIGNALQEARTAMQTEAIDPVEVIHKFLKKYKAHLNKASVEVELKAPDKILNAQLLVSPAALQDGIFATLVDNAIQAMEGVPKKKLTIAVGKNPENNTVNYSFQDNGAGMGQETLERLRNLSPDERGFTTKGVEGTGLGLPLVKRTVEHMRGELTIESVLGGGSVFSVALPLSAIEADEEREIEWKRNVETPPKILVLEPEEALSKMVSEILAREGFQVVAVANGKEGLDIIKKQEVDAVITEQQMPEMIGTQFIEELSRTDHPKIPVAIVGGNIAFDEQGIKAAQQTGLVVGVFSKPTNPKKVLEAIYEARPELEQKGEGEAETPTPEISPEGDRKTKRLPNKPVKRILVMEDDPALTRIFSLILKMHRKNALIEMVESEEVALEIIQEPNKPPIDLLVLDQHFPKKKEKKEPRGDGSPVVIAKAVREAVEGDQTVIIVTSGVDRIMDDVEPFADGAAKKPISKDQFAQVLDKVENWPQAEGQSLGAIEQAILSNIENNPVLTEYFQSIFNGKDIGLFLNQIATHKEPLALVFSWEALKNGSMTEELLSLFELMPKLRIYVATNLSFEEIEEEISVFDPQGLLKDFREGSAKSQLNILAENSIQEAKKAAAHFVGKGPRGDAASAVIVMEDNVDEIRFLGTSELNRLAAVNRTEENEKGQLLGLPTLAVQIAIGVKDLPPNIERDERGIYRVFAFSLEELSVQLVQEIASRIAIAKAA